MGSTTRKTSTKSAVRVSRKAKQLAKYAPYKSGLEYRIAELLPNVIYENDKLKYTVPASVHTYTPDFRLSSTVYIEGKGRLLPSERKKHLLVKEQNPDIEIRFFFENANKPIYKGSNTTYADWCDKHGFLWTDLKRGLPLDWIK